jgi:hypothetical protein
MIMGKDTDVDDSVFSEERIMSLLDRGHESGVIDAEGIQMIDSIFEFDDLLAYEIMTPRTDVFMFDADADRSEYLEELMELTHSRIPVFEGDPDNIIGILHIKDYLYNATKKGFDNVNIRKLLRPAYFVPETKNIDSLFREMKKEKQLSSAYIMAFFFAWLINEMPSKLRVFMTVLFYAPSVSGNIYFIWQYMFSNDSYGLVNGLLISWGIISEPILWFTDPKYNLFIIILVQLNREFT